ncbi:MAG: hypothetical protein K2X81_25920 [Candidatus Obscuribacterales bacterium]|nr:hypothetical protein [Candidatus Obscuribacterales bacterium]
MRSPKKTEGSNKSLSANATDLALTFFFKTAIPLIPIIAIFVLANVVMNMEINGLYRGNVPGIGALALDIQEDNDKLSGSLVLGQRNRFVIAQGKMLDDTSMEIECKKRSASDINAISDEQNPGNSSNSKTLNSPTESTIPESLDEKAIPDQVAEETKKSETTVPTIKITATKDQNTLRGTIEKDGQSVHFMATRNSFSSFFGKRYIMRTLKYIGIK